MKSTTATRRSFNAALVSVLSTDSDRWPQPVIYAQDIDGEMTFDACNAPAVPSDAIVWLNVEGDSFGELTGNHQADADGIEANSFEDAVNDVIEAFQQARPTLAEAQGIILDHVPDWDPEVLRNAAQAAIDGGSPWEFEGRPEDMVEMEAFVKAFKEIQA